MMTREMMVATVEALGADATLSGAQTDCLEVTLEDFEGFDDDWEEVDRDYDHPEAVAQFQEMLETECLSQDGDFYVTYHFDGFDVCLGYASFEI